MCLMIMLLHGWYGLLWRAGSSLVFQNLDSVKWKKKKESELTCLHPWVGLEVEFGLQQSINQVEREQYLGLTHRAFGFLTRIFFF